MRMKTKICKRRWTRIFHDHQKDGIRRNPWTTRVHEQQEFLQEGWVRLVGQGNLYLVKTLHHPLAHYAMTICQYHSLPFEKEDHVTNDDIMFRRLRSDHLVSKAHWVGCWWRSLQKNSLLLILSSFCQHYLLIPSSHTSYLSFFLHEQNFWRIKFTPKKRVNYNKIHRKLPIFCVITAKYTVNCQFFALNL